MPVDILALFDVKTRFAREKTAARGNKWTRTFTKALSFAQGLLETSM